MQIGSVLSAIPVSFSGSPSISGAVTVIGNPSISGTVNIAGNPSISGTIGASIIGAVNINPASVQVLNPVSVLAVTQSGAWSASLVGVIPGSVVAFQGTTPWTIGSVYGNVSGSIAGTYSNSNVASTVTGVAMMFKQNISTSIMTEVSPTFPLPTVGSVSGSVGVTGTPSISGTVLVGGTPNVNTAGSVVAFQGGAWNTSVVGNVGQLGTIITSISGQVTVVSSITGGIFPISGSVAAVVTNNVTVVSSIAGGIFPISGSVAAVITNTNVNVGGSVVGFQGGAWTASVVGNVGQIGTIISSISGTIVVQSIVGTYAEDVGHASGDVGLFSLGVRNDAMPSITSADLDYSPIAVGPVGEVLTANAPITKWVRGNASMASGISQPIIAAQGASIFTYVTAVQLVNTTATNAFVTFLDSAAGGIIGFAAAPANGGSNIIIPNAWRTLANGAFHSSINSLASVLVSAQGFISKT